MPAPDLGRKARRSVPLREVVAAMPGTRLEILARIGWTTFRQDRALSRVLQSLRLAGRVRFAHEHGPRGGRSVWHRVECMAYAPTAHGSTSGMVRCQDRTCPERASCERWLRRGSGKAVQATFRAVSA